MCVISAYTNLIKREVSGLELDHTPHSRSIAIIFLLSATNPLLNAEATASFLDKPCLSGILEKYALFFRWITLGG